MIIEGYATPEATKRLAEKLTDFAFKKLGKTDLYVTNIGFGTYKLDVRSPIHLEALKKGLLEGINLINTSANYTDGNSETLIGDVLSELINSNRLSRESVVLMTKGGYIQGENLEFSLERKEDGDAYPELIEFSDDLEYCIHPEFLEEQINYSIERLNIDTIDVYLLEHPEQYLKWAKLNNIKKEEALTEYYSRIKKAFSFLEKLVSKGKIKHYGISSNTFALNPDEYEYTSLNKILEIANAVSSNNHFNVVEFPLNLAETEAYSFKNNENQTNLLQTASENNLGIITNRPINVIHKENSIKLAEPVIKNAPEEKQLREELTVIKDLNIEITKKLSKYKNKEFSKLIKSKLNIVEEIESDSLDYENPLQWQIDLKENFFPKLKELDNIIKKESFTDEELEIDLFGLTYKIGRLFGNISNFHKKRYLLFTGNIKENIKNELPELASTEKLSNLAIKAIRSIPEVSSVLVGMIQPGYVSDCINELKTSTVKNFDLTKVNFDKIIKVKQ